MLFVLHVLLIESGIQHQRRQSKKSCGSVKEKTKTLFGLARCVIKFFTRHKLICICALLSMSSTKSYAKKGVFFFNEANPLFISLLSQQETSEMGTDRRGETFK